MRKLAPYSDCISRAPARLRRLIDSDPRIIGFSIEEDGVFIYTDSSKWDDGNGSGTFRGDTVAEAISRYKTNVQENPGGIRR